MSQQQSSKTTLIHQDRIATAAPPLVQGTASGDYLEMGYQPYHGRILLVFHQFS